MSKLTNPQQFGSSMNAHEILESVEMAPGKDLNETSAAAWASGRSGTARRR